MEVDPPRMERRSKLAHNPAREAVVPSTKHPRTASLAPTEKAPKHPRADSSKPPKALPKMKMAIPTISGAATSETSAKDGDQEMEDIVTSNPEKTKVALNKKDQELAEAQKAALDKTKLAEEKILPKL
ncbi:protein piccolo-like [Triticum dicoccoides]|uniref:protein piccolo-like n=1 Tax=Triticum dicoccoides TaxID=85692 RepID=UPI001890FB05|nr:protein piccolo-like [Triticum dicoccoides]